MNPFDHRKNLWSQVICSILLLSVSFSGLASHPRPQDMTNVIRMAHRIEQTATRLHHVAENAAHHGGRSESQAKSAVHELQNKATHFHKTAEKYRQNPEHTERDFRKLQNSFAEAKNYERVLSSDHATEHLYQEITAQMEALTRFYTETGGGFGFDYQSVKAAAHNTDSAAKEFHRHVSHEFNHDRYLSWPEKDAITKLHLLMERAQHLHHRVERGGITHAHLHEDYANLKYAYENAKWSLNYLNFTYHANKQFQRIDHSMQRLAGIFENSHQRTR